MWWNSERVTSARLRADVTRSLFHRPYPTLCTVAVQVRNMTYSKKNPAFGVHTSYLEKKKL
jgi:hypothetical protein